MKSLITLSLALAVLQSCAGGSVACRKASQGDLPCQSLNGPEFQTCQLAVQAARMTCQSEQIQNSPDATGYYHPPSSQ